MPLSPTEATELAQQLEELIVELESTLADSRESARPVELDQAAVGRVSRIDAIAQQKMLEANRAAQQSRLQLARSALRRFEEGEYGECLECGEEIDLARLRARPESTFCLECQSNHERR